MKRFFILLFLAVSAIFQSFSASRPEISYQAGMVCFASRGIKRDVIAYSSEIQATGRNYSGTFGFQGYGGMIDFSLSGEFYPKFCTWEFSKRYIKLGVGAIYHFQNQLGIAYENDFIAKSIFSIVSKKNFI